MLHPPWSLDDPSENAKLLRTALVGSLLVHSMTFAALWLTRGRGLPPPAPEVTRIRILPPVSGRASSAMPERRKEIVETRRPSVEETPRDARFVSEWSQRVLRETRARAAMGRGPGGTGGRGGAPRSAPAPGDAAPPSKALLPSQEVMTRIAEGERPSGGENGGGSAQVLADVPEGGVTLLNTKAFRYAGFVRRVAYRIFDDWTLLARTTTWRRSDLDRVTLVPTVEAILDPSGNLLDLRVARTSGSPSFDRVVVEACRRGAWDRNPPAGAEASDGRIHFYFSVFPDLLEVALGD